MTTRKPRSASASAIALPIPRPAPVTKATLVSCAVIAPSEIFLTNQSNYIDLISQNGIKAQDAFLTKASGSPHLVYPSAEGVERKSGFGHYESKWAIEQRIRDLKLPATILRPVGFMDAFGAPAMQRGMFLGIFRANFGLSHRIQFVATYDIGWFAARALEDPERYAGRVIPLAGDELSVGEIIRTFKTVTGRKPWVAPIPAFLARKMMPKEFLDMFTWIREKGFKHSDFDRLGVIAVHPTGGAAKTPLVGRHDMVPGVSQNWDQVSPARQCFPERTVADEGRMSLPCFAAR